MVNPVSENQFDDGGSVFNDRVVNPESAGDQLASIVAMDEKGNFVVVWEDDSKNDGNYRIYARGFYADGSQRFPDRSENSVSSGQHRKPKTAMDNGGNFVVVWEDDRDGNGWQPRFRGDLGG